MPTNWGSRGYGTVGGGSETDQISLSGPSVQPASTISFWAWINPTGHGLANFGRVIDWDNALWRVNDNEGNVSGTYGFTRSFDVANGRWTFTSPSFNAWHPLGVSYNDSSTGNDPIVYLDGTKLTTGGGGLTPSSGPVGTAVVIGNPPTIGNIQGDFSRTYDGYIAQEAMWNVLLTDLEFASMARGVSPLRIRPKSLVFYLPTYGLLSTEPDLSGNNNNGAVTGTSVAFGPPVGSLISYPRFLDAPTLAPAFGSGDTLIRPRRYAGELWR